MKDNSTRRAVRRIAARAMRTASSRGPRACTVEVDRGADPMKGSKATPMCRVPAQAGTHVPVRTMPFVYLLASKPYGTLYVGSTFELARRVWQHKTRAISGFTPNTALTVSCGSKPMNALRQHWSGNRKSRSGSVTGKSI